MIDGYICPICGEDMEYWENRIYECPDCGTMINEDDIEEMY